MCWRGRGCMCWRRRRRCADLNLHITTYGYNMMRTTYVIFERSSKGVCSGGCARVHRYLVNGCEESACIVGTKPHILYSIIAYFVSRSCVRVTPGAIHNNGHVAAIGCIGEPDSIEVVIGCAKGNSDIKCVARDYCCGGQVPGHDRVLCQSFAATRQSRHR